jgi:hypothetical protein
VRGRLELVRSGSAPALYGFVLNARTCSTSLLPFKVRTRSVAGCDAGDVDEGMAELAPVAADAAVLAREPAVATPST